jgi:tetratricopeptide (TPR) repeat protein
MTMKKETNDPKKQLKEPSPETSPAMAKPSDYLRAVKASLKAGNQKQAFALLQKAALHYPDAPLVLSYYGCLLSIVDKRYRTGIETCKKAIAMIEDMKEDESLDKDAYYPVLYLNLGRAFIAARKKQDAMNAFKSGLTYDRSHYELLKEIKGLGLRKAPPIPFLDRSNVLNKYIGKILQKTAKKTARPSGRSSG